MQRVLLPLLILTLGLVIGCTDEASEPATTDEPMTADTATVDDAMANSQAMQPATVGVYEQQPYGQYLVDGENMSLYIFLQDEQGSGNSTCYDACAEAWPPLQTEGEPVTEAAAIDTSMLGTIARRDGSQQVTYNGWPLYYYAQDQEPGDVEGQDVHGFGAEWYLIGPNGEQVEAEEEEH